MEITTNMEIDEDNTTESVESESIEETEEDTETDEETQEESQK